MMKSHFAILLPLDIYWEGLAEKINGLTETPSPITIFDLIPDNYVYEFAYGYDIFIDSRMKVIYANNNLLSIHKLLIVIR